VVPTSPRPGAAQIDWDVEVERADASNLTYWISVRNVTPDPVNIEARYAVLN
jgi:glycyl-tRNA synthetase alpha subunit